MNKAVPPRKSSKSSGWHKRGSRFEAWGPKVIRYYLGEMPVRRSKNMGAESGSEPTGQRDVSERELRSIAAPKVHMQCNPEVADAVVKQPNE